ncbi:hypothetical protein [Maritalea mediterranea]|uniref:Cytochrome-c oxidase n=1 Tax=Maritalea mediterranea TaxID=2909667 RepID=A0ABS9E9L1_9HYPH|nr:hypothetical protein [Maritalea mediterranea]MCF4099512.1 hypothetical protein [Maritalea mediterranea]
MNRLSFWFFISALVYLLLGVGLGIYMAGSKDFLFAPVHGHLNLVGWVSFALYGLFYQAVPIASRQRMATVHFALASLGLWTMIPGIALFELGITEALAAIGALLTLCAILVFAAVVMRNGPKSA